MTAVTITTRLDAVNRMLSAVGQLPVSTITGSIPADATAALAILNEIDLETQMRGWHFNMEKTTLAKDGSGKIAVPANCARLAVDKFKYPSKDITIRDDSGTSRLYDKQAHTFVIGMDLEAIVVTIYDFEQTPEPFRRYVTVRSARIFQDRTNRSQTGHAYTARDEIDALRFLRQHESDANIATVFDSYAAFRVIDRNYPRLPGSSLKY